MSVEFRPGVSPEHLSPQDRKNYWISTAANIYNESCAANIPVVFRGSLHAEFLQPGFVHDGYKAEKHTWRDLDLLVLGNVDESIEAVLKQFGNDVPIGLGANNYIQFEGDQVNLIYKDICIPVDPSLFAPSEIEYDGKKLPFLDPLVHYHLFETIGFGGIFGARLRDRAKMELYKNSQSRYDDLSEEERNAIFQPFYEYRKQRAKRYPVETLANKLRGDIPAPGNKHIRSISRGVFQGLNATPLPENTVSLPSCLNLIPDEKGEVFEGREVKVIQTHGYDKDFALKAYQHEETMEDQLETGSDIKRDLDTFQSLGMSEELPQTDLFIAEDPKTEKPRLYALQPWIEGTTLNDANALDIFKNPKSRRTLHKLLTTVARYQDLFGFVPDTVGAHGLRIAGKRIPSPLNLVPFFSKNIMIDTEGNAYFIDPHVRKTRDAQGKVRGLIQSLTTRATGDLLKPPDTEIREYNRQDVQRVQSYLNQFPETTSDLPDEYFLDPEQTQKKLLVVTNYPPGRKLNGLDFTVRMMMRYLNVNKTGSVLLTTDETEYEQEDKKLGRIVALKGHKLTKRMPTVHLDIDKIEEVIKSEQPEGIILFNPLVLGGNVSTIGQRMNIPVIATADTRIGQYLRYQIPDPIGKTLAHRLEDADNKIKQMLPVDTWVAPSDSYRANLESNGIPNVVTVRREGSYGTRDRQPRDAELRNLIAPNGEIILLSVGKIAAVKNTEFLARVSRLLEKEKVPYKMVFAGGNTNQDEYESIMTEFNPDHALFLGPQDGERLLRLFGAADICLQPSNTETLGLVAIEALTAGIPVIGADAIGNRDTIKDHFNGRLISTTEPGDAQRWALTIKDFATHPEMLNYLRDHAEYPAYVAQSWKEYARDMMNLCTK